MAKGEAYAEGVTNHPYVRVIDMVQHSVNIPALVYLTQATHEKIARYTISSKDIYISIAGTIGQVGAIPESIDGANLTENAAKIVLEKNAPVDRDYLIWYLFACWCRTDSRKNDAHDTAQIGFMQNRRNRGSYTRHR